MIKILQVRNIDSFVESRRQKTSEKDRKTVQAILNDVRKNGDTPVKKYERKFNGRNTSQLRVSEKEIKVIQRRLNGHARSLVKIFNIGESKGEHNMQRCWNNASSDAEAVPLLKLGIKTHKPVKENGDPECRIIIGASNCTTSRPGDIIADVLEPVAWNGGQNASNEECQSTEEMLSMIEEASDKLEKEGMDPMTMSLDVKKLYNNMVIREAAKEVAQEIIETKIEFKNIDYVVGAKYVAASCSREEIVQQD